MAACSDQAPTTTSLTAQEVDALQRHQYAAVKIITNQKIQAGNAANKLSGLLRSNVCTIGRATSSLLPLHVLSDVAHCSRVDIPAEKSVEVDKLQKKIRRP